MSPKKKDYLIAVDLEGVHGVVGEPYKTLTQSESEYKKAVSAATEEINVVVKALKECGVDRVVVWDNHGGGNNLDFSKIDPRVVRETCGARDRLDFADKYDFGGIAFIGYHAREGTLGAPLAHTYSSVSVQYFEIDGEQVGEIDIDSYLAAEKGVPCVFVASDDKCAEQVVSRFPSCSTVITKFGKGRNAAVFRNTGEVLSEIYAGVKRAVAADIRPVRLKTPCTFKVRFTRAEKAAEVKEKLFGRFGKTVSYGEDSHILVASIDSAQELRYFL